MSGDFEQLERELEQEFAALAPKLATPAPRAVAVARTKAAVAAECQHMRRRRWLITLRPAIGVAAAVLLIVSFWTPAGSGTAATGVDPASALDEWVDAFDASGDQLAAMFEYDWLLDGGSDNDNGTADPLDLLEDSLESFEQLMET